jgi:hypothetical protein
VRQTPSRVNRNQKGFSVPIAATDVESAMTTHRI